MQTIVGNQARILDRAIRLAAAITLFSAGLAGVAQDTAKSEATNSITPYSLFQDSAVTSSTDTINATRVPVVDSKGAIHYWDVALLFNATSSGQLSLAAGYPEITPSANPNSANFKPGAYVGPSDVDGGKAIITVSGPSVLPGGGTAWTISAAVGAATGTNPSTAVWYVESSIAANPLASRIKAAGITSTQLSYGVGSGGTWCRNSLLGFSQVGNSLAISDFSNCVDRNTTVDVITYTRKQQ